VVPFQIVILPVVFICILVIGPLIYIACQKIVRWLFLVDDTEAVCIGGNVKQPYAMPPLHVVQISKVDEYYAKSLSFACSS